MADREPGRDWSREIEHYTEQIRPLVEGRRFLLISGPIAGLAPLAAQLRALGADRPFALGTITGVGEIPGEDVLAWRTLGVSGENIIAAFRAYEAQLADLPAELRAAIDAWDPDGSARVLGTTVMGDLREVAGRPRYGGRPASWAAFEDKVGIDAFWDAVGIRRAPSAVVPASPLAMCASARRLDRGRGTILAGDAREGLNGGAVYVRWIRSKAALADAAPFFTRHCDRVRVMPFLEGIPCSIHGIVFPDTVIALRPIEQISLRSRESERLLYSGLASFWDPPERDREEMRDAARRAGAALRERVGYRGPFSIDGVLTSDGFRPTELNARFSAGLNVIARSAPGLPFAPLMFALQAGETLDWRPQLLERLLVDCADRNRGGGGWVAFPRPRTEHESHAIVEETGTYRLAREGETPDARLALGPGDVGGFLHFAPEPGKIAPGPSLAPRVAKVLALADRELGTAFGPLEPARDARRV